MFTISYDRDCGAPGPHAFVLLREDASSGSARLRGRDCVKKFRDDDDKMNEVGFWLGSAFWNLTYSGDSCGLRRIAASIAGL
jgi:hypothetical protein